MHWLTFIILVVTPAFTLAFTLDQPLFAVYSLSQDTTNLLTIFSGNNQGELTYVKQIPTNGTGSSITGLESQHGLIVYQNYIFGVNPGSNTVSMFSISATDPTAVTLVATANSGYDWPLSLTAWDSNVCVVNGGKTNGVRCWTYSSSGFSSSFIEVSLGLNLTTPPAVHVGPAQISFTNDGLGLVVSVKGLNPPVWLIPFGSSLGTPVPTIPHGAVSFGFAIDTDDTVVLTDANPIGNGSGIILVDPSIGTTNTITFLTPYFTIPGEQASCWVVRSNLTSHFYVANAGSGAISEISRSGTTLAVVKEYPLGSTAKPTDMTIATFGGFDWLYAYQNGNNTIAILKIIAGGQAVIVGTTTTGETTPGGIASYVLSSSSPSGPTSGPTVSPTSNPSAPTKPATPAAPTSSAFSLHVASIFVLALVMVLL